MHLADKFTQLLDRSDLWVCDRSFQTLHCLEL